MDFDFKLPDVGEGLHEGTLVEWLVQVGEQVALDQPFARVETDKAVVELPAPKPGVVRKLHFSPGDVIEVGQVMISFGNADGAAGERPERPTNPVARTGANGDRAARPTHAPTSPVQRARSADDPRRYLATPHTRALARRLGVQLSEVTPTGRAGKITDADVERAAAGRAEESRPTTEQPRPTARPAPAAPATRQRHPPTQIAPAVQAQSRMPAPTRPERDEPVERVPLTHLRKVIAEAMAHSTRTAAHVTHVDEADVTELLGYHRRARARLQDAGVSSKLTLLPYFIKGIVGALKNHPLLNASYDEERQELLLKRYYHIGVAVDTGEGLIVPVLRDADKKDLLTIAGELEDLAQRARSRRLRVEELRGASFTVSSLGPLGGVFATPIIHQPQQAIIGLHAIKERPAVVDGEVAVRSIMYVSLSYDHRIVDGAVAARFISEVVALLSSPDLLMLRL